MASLSLTGSEAIPDGLWGWVASVSRGEGGRLEVPAGGANLQGLAATFRLLARALEIAAGAGRVLANEKDLAASIMDPLLEAAERKAARACSSCGVLWDERAHACGALAPKAVVGVVVCPECGAKGKLDEARAKAEDVIYERTPKIAPMF